MVKHLLHHSAGWERDRAGDPVFWKVGKYMNVTEPVAPGVLINYMMGRKLQFAPGEGKSGKRSSLHVRAHLIDWLSQHVTTNQSVCTICNVYM